VKVAQWLCDKYKIHNIKIVPYNSKGNAPIEHRHGDVQEALLKVLRTTATAWLDLGAGAQC
jgi:hypothetical protein